MFCLSCKHEGAYWARNFKGIRVLICPKCETVSTFDEVMDFLFAALKGIVMETTRNDLRKAKGK
jgi:hypothetical protein